MSESAPPPEEALSDLARQVERLNDELEAAYIERDRYKAATEIMSQALEQMNGLLSPSKSPAESGE